MKKRKLLALCLVPALLAGCAAGTSDNTEPAATTAQVKAITIEPTAAPPRPRRPTRRRTPPSAPWGRSCCGRPANRGRTPCSPHCLWPWPCP